MMRRSTRNFKLGNLGIGNEYPVSTQSMTTIPVSDVEGNLAQIGRLYSVGCDIVRLAFDRAEEAVFLRQVIERSPLPVVADIQFDAASAIAAIKSGAAGIRLNPGLLKDPAELREIAGLLQEYDIPVRVGANSGSIGTNEIRLRTASGADHDEALCDALVEGALQQCRSLESFGVRKIKVALKASSVKVTVMACRKFAEMTDYPLHLGVTEAGTAASGSIKSAVGIGSLLLDGIGDTIRVSLTAAPEEEISVARRILASCGLRDEHPEIISCPGCGRTEIDLPGLVAQVENLVERLKRSDCRIKAGKIAVMGCPVNGPGEAKDADLGIAGSRSGEQVILFQKGMVLGAFSPEEGFARFAGLLSETD